MNLSHFHHCVNVYCNFYICASLHYFAYIQITKWKVHIYSPLRKMLTWIPVLSVFFGCITHCYYFKPRLNSYGLFFKYWVMLNMNKMYSHYYFTFLYTVFVRSHFWISIKILNRIIPKIDMLETDPLKRTSLFV